MIRRINKLKNVGRFVELKSRGGTQSEFAKVNVIYSRNAGGKTTLCDVFRSLREAQPGSLLNHAAHLVADLTEVDDWGKRYYYAETDGSDAGDVDPKELLGYVKQTLEIISR